MLPSRLERWFGRVFGDPDPRSFGSGWMSGTASVFLGVLAVFGVVTFAYPGLFATTAFVSLYPVGVIRALLEVVIGLSFLLAATSLLLRRRKVLGLTGLVLSLGALLTGGGAVERQAGGLQPLTIGLDWFALNLLLLAVVFVPVERAFPKRPEQKTFRPGWTTDGMHFLVSHLAVQVLTFLTLLPATTLAAIWQPVWLHAAVRAQPVWVQAIEIVIVSDLAQYWIHRAFHVVPALWRVHAVHHSSEVLDWLAGSRLHLGDVLATRGLVLVPIFLLGFSEPALYVYLVLVSFHAVFIHANVRFRFGWLDHVIVTPRVHHWHHAVRPIDRNFAVHLPVLDRLFGTLHLPGDEWPDEYGIEGEPVPEGWTRQLVYPFRNERDD